MPAAELEGHVIVAYGLELGHVTDPILSMCAAGAVMQLTSPWDDPDFSWLFRP
jgi:hypothetical protein